MKELSTEEKAQRYDKALEKAWKELQACGSTDCDAARQIFRFFPELKESEDERIRKSLLEYLHTLPNHYAHSGVCAPEWIAWLEKQGEQKSIDDLTQQEAMDIAVAKCFEQGKQKLADNVEPKFKFGDIVRNKKSGLEQRLGGCIEDVYEGAFPFRIKDQDDWELVKQKPTNKVKPKFKEGEWIISDTVDKDYHICKIIGIKDGNYTIESIYGYKGYNQFDVFDTAYKLWTVQDAQDGDVLVTDSGRPFIFKGCLDKNHPNSPVAYCGISSMNEFFVSEGINWWTDKNVYPATKEQYDTLMKAIADAGYVFDFEKKELKKIEQPHAWSKEDEKRTEQICDDLKCAYENFRSGKNVKGLHFEEIIKSNIDWLKSLKDRVRPQPKQEWSEEDEKIALSIEQVINCASLLNIVPEKVDKIRTWLKSLKKRIIN